MDVDGCWLTQPLITIISKINTKRKYLCSVNASIICFGFLMLMSLVSQIYKLSAAGGISYNIVLCVQKELRSFLYCKSWSAHTESIAFWCIKELRSLRV